MKMTKKEMAIASESLKKNVKMLDRVLSTIDGEDEVTDCEGKTLEELAIDTLGLIYVLRQAPIEDTHRALAQEGIGACLDLITMLFTAIDALQDGHEATV